MNVGIGRRLCVCVCVCVCACVRASYLPELHDEVQEGGLSSLGMRGEGVASLQ